ncbi:MAG: hypothetical protein NZ840_07725 [Anaerolineales bacterium]|nr:hypothetical protein [Anaerolineales bacterium]MDW8161927.1 hypothetical protein [Anaerolineales bacterium]
MPIQITMLGLGCSAGITSRWDRLRAIGGSRDWYVVNVDLGAYQGEKIRVKFFCEPQRGFDEEEGVRLPKLYNKQILYLQEVKVVPDGSLC